MCVRLTPGSGACQGAAQNIKCLCVSGFLSRKQEEERPTRRASRLNDERLNEPQSESTGVLHAEGHRGVFTWLLCGIP